MSKVDIVVLNANGLDSCKDKKSLINFYFYVHGPAIQLTKSVFRSVPNVNFDNSKKEKLNQGVFTFSGYNSYQQSSSYFCAYKNWVDFPLKKKKTKLHILKTIYFFRWLGLACLKCMFLLNGFMSIFLSWLPVIKLMETSHGTPTFALPLMIINTRKTNWRYFVFRRY